RCTRKANDRREVRGGHELGYDQPYQSVQTLSIGTSSPELIEMPQGTRSCVTGAAGSDAVAVESDTSPNSWLLATLITAAPPSRALAIGAVARSHAASRRTAPPRMRVCFQPMSPPLEVTLPLFVDISTVRLTYEVGCV